ncbi:scinderin like a [Xyrichtys novacula]|uniref:Scinderin like a n=1 Tax=Xyrichtys novacula TaxID=13765 RepID=A0AAV1FFE3_XYRNO|nr:scinderin like a [Xyrichtys novacula]
MKGDIIQRLSTFGGAGMRLKTPLCQTTEVSAVLKTELSSDSLCGNLEEQLCSRKKNSLHPATAVISHLALSKMVHKELLDAGKKPGLEIWRVEKMELAPVPKELYGKFFTGDSYLLLHTSKSTPTFHSIHIWHGQEASPDERGCAAIFMVQLDDHLGQSPTQYSEFQGNESSTFQSYFKKGIRYMKGGIASGFKQVVQNSIRPTVLHVKGRRNITAMEVDMNWSSFNNGDCFIIDLGKVFYLWVGKNANRFERLKTTGLAIEIRDSERQGQAALEHVEEGSEPEEIIKLLGPKPDLPDPVQDDDAADLKNTKKASLYRISDATGTMKKTLIAEINPFKQDMLHQDEIFLLDNGVDRRVFIWKGKMANKEERKAAKEIANKVISDEGYPSNTQVIVLPDGAETMAFKQFFSNWLDKDETTGPCQAFINSKIAKVAQIPFDATALYNNSAMAAFHGMVDDGSGKVQIWRVEGGDKVPVDPSTYGQFFGGDCYLVLYSYNTGGREKHIIYTWSVQGLKCSKDELGASAFLTVNLDDSMGGVATQVRVTQGQEPAHLMSLFKGKPLIIHAGGTSRKHGESQPANKRLFHIRHTSTAAHRIVEVEPVAPSLNTNDIFVLKTQAFVYVWCGKGANPQEMDAAKYISDLLGGTVTEVEETKEPEMFWSALGGKKDYQTSPLLQMTIKQPRLFGCSNKTGSLIADEVPGEFTQMDLAPDDVMILDIWEQIFVWIGKEANETEKTGSPKIAQDYINSDPSGRHGIPISLVKQGMEPPTFTGWFLAWDPKMWDKSTTP